MAYPAIIYRAYAVADGLERAKRELRSGNVDFERALRSVSTKGIWIGSLRTYERDARVF